MEDETLHRRELFLASMSLALVSGRAAAQVPIPRTADVVTQTQGPQCTLADAIAAGAEDLAEARRRFDELDEEYAAVRDRLEALREDGDLMERGLEVRIVVPDDVRDLIEAPGRLSTYGAYVSAMSRLVDLARSSLAGFLESGAFSVDDMLVLLRANGAMAAMNAGLVGLLQPES